MKFTSAKSPLWPISLINLEQWNNHCVSIYQKTSLKLPLFPDENHCQAGPIKQINKRINE